MHDIKYLLNYFAFDIYLIILRTFYYTMFSLTKEFQCIALFLSMFICIIGTNATDNLIKFNLKKCEQHNDCNFDEFCDLYSFWMRIKEGGKVCIKKIKDSNSCSGYNYQCLSHHCHWFNCVSKQIGNKNSNGTCNTSEDCKFEQFCQNEKCVNRKKYGWCSSDKQCLSNHCSFFKCEHIKASICKSEDIQCKFLMKFVFE